MTQPPSDQDPRHAWLGYKKLNRTWAKAEILLGLTASGIGLLLGQWTSSRATPEFAWQHALAALALIVPGGYLTLAGHRSHPYQSANETTAFLLAEMERLSHTTARPGTEKAHA